MTLDPNDAEAAESRATSMPASHGIRLDAEAESSDQDDHDLVRRRSLTALTLLGFCMGLAALLGLQRYRLAAGEIRSSRGVEQLFASPYHVDASSDDTQLEFMDDVGGLPGVPYTPAQLQQKRAEWNAPPSVPEVGKIPTPPPTQNRSKLDSNDCFKGEEFFAGACYANCSSLTAGQFPIRSAPNTCCKEEPCIFPSLLSFNGYFVCMGYAVDSKGACPRQPGHCNSDEAWRMRDLPSGDSANGSYSEYDIPPQEIFEGKCYKPCATLSQNVYPYRVGPMSCCKYEPPCFNIFNIKSEGFAPCTGWDVGGFGHNCSHDPTV